MEEQNEKIIDDVIKSQLGINTDAIEEVDEEYEVSAEIALSLKQSEIKLEENKIIMSQLQLAVHELKQKVAILEQEKEAKNMAILKLEQKVNDDSVKVIEIQNYLIEKQSLLQISKIL